MRNWACLRIVLIMNIKSRFEGSCLWRRKLNWKFNEVLFMKNVQISQGWENDEECKCPSSVEHKI